VVKPKEPVHEIVDGNCTVKIWLNEGRKGPWYSVVFLRTYLDEVGWKGHATSFGVNDLLRISELARAAYAWIRVKTGHKEDSMLHVSLSYDSP